MKFPMFMAHTERAFDNMVISLYMVLINGMFLAHIERAGAQRVRDIVVQRTPINCVLCQPLRIPIKMRREYTTNHLNKWKRSAHKISNRILPFLSFKTTPSHSQRERECEEDTWLFEHAVYKFERGSHFYDWISNETNILLEKIVSWHSCYYDDGNKYLEPRMCDCALRLHGIKPFQQCLSHVAFGRMNIKQRREGSFLPSINAVSIVIWKRIKQMRNGERTIMWPFEGDSVCCTSLFFSLSPKMAYQFNLLNQQ